MIGDRLAGIDAEPVPLGEVRGQAEVDPAVIEGKPGLAGDPPLGEREDEEDADARAEEEGVIAEAGVPGTDVRTENGVVATAFGAERRCRRAPAWGRAALHGRSQAPVRDRLGPAVGDPGADRPRP